MPKASPRIEQLADQLQEVTKLLASESGTELSASRLRHIRKSITEAHTQLRDVIEKLDPIKRPGFVFDPSNPNIVGRIVAITMIAQPRKPLAGIERFYGSGVYGLYYRGEFAPYAEISGREHPIYVGKADPADPSGKTAVEQGDRLANRLGDHLRNISRAESSLKVADFEYRALVVQTGWQAAAENYLINLFQPIWNNEIGICYGFGKHGDDPTTRANLRSPWDTLHPGRDWAHRDPNMKDARPKRQIIEDIQAHLKQHRPMRTVDEIVRNFLEEIRVLT